MFEFWMHAGVLGDWPEVQITAEQYDQIRSGRDVLGAAHAFEQRYQLLLENFREYEQSLLDIALRQMISWQVDWADFEDIKRLVNRRLSNCLASVLLYLDQGKRDLPVVIGDGLSAKGWFQKTTDQQRSRHLGFQLMEVLRDVIQHQELPIQSFALPMTRHGDLPETSRISFNALAFVELNDLRTLIYGGGRRQKQFDQASFKRLEARADRKGHVDLSPLLREYVEGVSEVHAAFRDLAEARVASARKIMAATIAQYQECCGREIERVLVQKLRGDVEDERVHVHLEVADHLCRLHRPRAPLPLSRSVIASDVEGLMRAIETDTKHARERTHAVVRKSEAEC